MENKTRILIVDDEASIRFVLEEALSQDGYDVEAASSGEAALQRISEQAFDLALVDLKMPGIGGMEVLAAIRQQSPDTAVIILTAYASPETAVEALHRGAHDYLLKPCKAVKVRESVRAALLKRHRELRRRELLDQLEHSLTATLEDLRAVAPNNPPLPRSTPAEPPEEEDRLLERSGLTVDLVRHVATLDGHVLELSPTEFDLVAHLLRETPRVISPQELVREVRGHESESQEAADAIRYHIHRIRQKMKETTGRSDVIRTVRGVGYAIGE